MHIFPSRKTPVKKYIYEKIHWWRKTFAEFFASWPLIENTHGIPMLSSKKTRGFIDGGVCVPCVCHWQVPSIDPNKI